MSSSPSPQAFLSEIVVQHPEAIAVFERFRLDFCCRGNRPLEIACREKGLDTAHVIGAIDDIARPARPQPALDDIEELLTAIVDNHHAKTRRLLTLCTPLMDKVLRVHGAHAPQLARVHDILAALVDDLVPHLHKEEVILFPAIRALVQAKHAGQTLPFDAGALEPVFDCMTHDHDAVGSLLHSLADVTDDFVPPTDACGSWRGLWSGLHDLSRDLQVHVHLENNVVFPLVRRFAAFP